LRVCVSKTTIPYHWRGAPRTSMGQVAMRSIASNPADPHARPRKQAAATAPHIVHGEESSLLYAQGEESSVVSTTAYQPQPERRINPNEYCVVVVILILLPISLRKNFVLRNDSCASRTLMHRHHITGLNLLDWTKFQRFLCGKSVFLNSKFPI